jgi:hypothetical protein
MNNKNRADHGQYRPDFDELLTLAKEDSALFEAKRLEYIEGFFSNLHSKRQRRLRGLQWQIDQTRKLARTPMASCITIMNMMWDSLHQLNDQQRTFVELTTKQKSAYPTGTTASATDATIIPFPTR